MNQSCEEVVKKVALLWSVFFFKAFFPHKQPFQFFLEQKIETPGRQRTSIPMQIA